MKIEPAKARYIVENVASGARVTIPTARNWFVILFLCAWLGGWFFGFTSASGELLNPSNKTPTGFLSFWLIGWTLGGIAACLSVLWQLFGQEVIEVNNGLLIRRILIGGIGLNREYDFSHIEAFRVSQMDVTASHMARWSPVPFGRTAGPIAFDYGARTIRFGSCLDEAEANGLVNYLKPFLPKSAVSS